MSIYFRYAILTISTRSATESWGIGKVINTGVIMHKTSSKELYTAMNVVEKLLNDENSDIIVEAIRKYKRYGIIDGDFILESLRIYHKHGILDKFSISDLRERLLNCTMK